MKVKRGSIHLSSQLDEILSHQDKNLLDSFLASLKEKYELDKEITIELREKRFHKRYLPGSIFSKKLGVFESIVKYLHENRKLSFKKIGKLTGRSPNNAAVTYKKAKKKSYPLLDEDFSLKIPLDIFSKNYTCFESICLYLKESMTYSEIASLLERDDRTIWTTYSRAVKKGGGK